MIVKKHEINKDYSMTSDEDLVKIVYYTRTAIPLSAVIEFRKRGLHLIYKKEK